MCEPLNIINYTGKDNKKYINKMKFIVLLLKNSFAAHLILFF